MPKCCKAPKDKYIAVKEGEVCEKQIHEKITKQTLMDLAADSRTIFG